MLQPLSPGQTPGSSPEAQQREVEAEETIRSRSQVR
jgi:hypothetical protein